MMRIFLADGNPEMIAAWKWAFEDISEIHILEAPPDEVDMMDAIVYPCDTFGLVSHQYADRWPGTAAVVRQSIIDNFYGELPAGQATVVSIPDKYKKKYLIVTPTSQETGADSRQDSYFAFRAVLRIVKSWNAKHSHPWQVVVCPNLAPAEPPHRVAFQMRVAYDALHGRGPVHDITTIEQAERFKKLLTTIDSSTTLNDYI